MRREEEKEIKEFQEWILDNADDPQVDTVLSALFSSDVPTAQEAGESETAFRSFAQRTGISPGNAPRAKSPWIKTHFRSALAIVLSALILICGGFAVAEISGSAEWTELQTAYSQTRKVELSDGTVVKLAPCSKIIYPEKFSGKQRRVFLVGEAFLDVAKDPRHRFVVSAGNMEIIVHGTRFNVSSFLNESEDEVALVEGSVEMRFKDNRSGSIFLKPGEMAKYDKVTGTTDRRKFAANYFEQVVEADGLQFTSDRLCDIASKLSRRFGVQITVEGTAAREERFFASFINAESLDEILSALNTQNHLSINKSEDLITIRKNNK